MKVKLSCITLLAFFVVACVSTSSLKPGNPLPGIGLAASKDTILFSWAGDAPIARNLRQGAQVNVLASYDTQYGPVTNEVLSSARVRAGFNGVQLKLADSLRFESTSPVCLRLAIGRTPIPVRIATYAQSSNGFYYDEWAQNASLQSEKEAVKADLRTVDINIRNFSQPNANFLRWQDETQVFSPQQCDSLNIVTDTSKPSTAISGKEKIEAAKEQCVSLYSAYHPNLPSIEQLTKAAGNHPTYSKLVQQIQNDFSKYSPGRVYFPHSDFPIDYATVRTVRSKKGLNEVVAGLVIEAYQACETEAKTRFDESLRDWLEVTNPKTIAARIEPLRKLCRTRFQRDKDRLEKLREFEQVKANVEENLRILETESKSALPDKKLLIAQACPAENL